MQLRLKTELSLEDYVAQQTWITASLDRCPLHAEAGCGFARLGTYDRKYPVPCKIARFYCRTGHVTFSLLPDCLAARMSGTLEQVQEAAQAMDRRVPLERAADRIRSTDEHEDAVGLASAVQWLKRRHRGVLAGLIAIAGMMPEVFAGCTVTVDGFAKALDTSRVLVKLREVAAKHLQRVPAPIGLHPRSSSPGLHPKPLQQSMRERR